MKPKHDCARQQPSLAKVQTNELKNDPIVQDNTDTFVDDNVDFFFQNDKTQYIFTLVVFSYLILEI